MVNQQTVEGTWNEIKGKLRQKWGQLTNEDLPEIQGDAEQIIGIIQRKTGESREAIEQYLQEVSGSAASAIDAATANVRDYAQNTARQATDQVRAGCIEAERFIRDRPMESLLVCFGAGVITGVVVAMSLRPR
jgi:uncharacterized protein YjbJ (UPF0337 family)